MAMSKRLFCLLGLIFSGFFFPASAWAECGGSTQCIGVGATAADAQTAGVGHHRGDGTFDLGTPLFTLAFGNQVTGTTSASQTIHVAAVTGAGTAILGPITLGGADAASFSITGGTCLTTNPVHGGATCTITVAFNPASLGPKAARVDVPLNPPAFVGAISGRSVGLTGTGVLPPAPVITSASTASGTTGLAFNYQITASNVPTSFNASGLPPGLSVNTVTGLISGTPTAAGTYNGTVTATNAGGADTKPLVFTITLAAPVITSGLAASGATGVAFAGYQITATNSPTSFTASSLPPGLSINTSTGVISGTPTSNGTFNTTITATNAAGTDTKTLVITISLTAPVIISGLTASGATGAAFAGYLITATNSPTSFNATGLPPGLSVNTATGLISGTPTLNGTFNTIITATNATSTDTKTLVFTISLTAPVITSASTASGTTGQAFSYQITASNLPSSFNATGLPAWLSVNTATGQLSGTPTTGATYNVTVTATNATGTASQALTITIGAVVPTAQNVSIQVTLNTPFTLNLASSITGPFITGVRITAAPAHVLLPLAVSGTVVTYTPANNYFGPDTFSYQALNNDGASPSAVVTVNVVGRPDPSQDPVVRGLIRSQAETAKRFSRAQIFNFQRRMESLHFGAAASATTGGTGLVPGRGPGLISGSGPVMGRNPIVGPGVGSMVGAADIAGNAQFGSSEPRQTAPAGAASGLLPASLANSLLSAATTRSLNLSHGSDRTDGSSGLPDGTGMWIGGTLHFGTRDETSDSRGLRFSTEGISVGVDRRFSDKLALGMGVGYARDKSNIGTDGSQTRSNGSSIAAYGSYHLNRNTFVDGLIGYGVLNSDTDRYVAVANDYARSNRRGDQLFGSIAAGYEHRRDALLLSPYGRLDFAIDRLEQVTETGAGANALTYFDQTLQTLQFSLGLRAESKHDTNFGWVLPRLRVELRHDFKDDRQATIAYADQFAGPRYSVTPIGVKHDALLVGIGSDFIFRGGLKLGVDYQIERSSGSESSHAIRLWLAKDLDGKGSPPGLSSSTLYENPVRVEAGYAWDDNLTRARDAADQLSDHIYSLNISKSTIFPVTTHTRVLVNGFLGGDKLYTYTGLDRFSGGGQAELQYRTSGEFDAPTFGIFGRATIDDYNSSLRSGYRYSLGVTARQSLTDRIDVFGALASNVRNADSVVFDAKDYSARLNLDYSLGQRGTPYLGGEYRRGDTVSTGRQSIDNIAIAKVFVQDDAYGNSQLFAYRFEARTVLWTLGYNRPLGPRDSLDVSWRHARSTPTQAPNYALAAGYGLAGTPRGNSSYTANQFSLVYLMRF